MRTFRKIRQDAGFKTQRALARVMHTVPQTVYRWDNGYRRPARCVMAELAKLLGCTEEEIIGGIAAAREQKLKGSSLNLKIVES